jgi:hypothetical protein
MPTLYGDLSYSLRRVDPATLRFEMPPGFPATVVLRPPLGSALRSVIIDGKAGSDFTADSVTLPRTASEVICVTMV